MSERLFHCMVYVVEGYLPKEKFIVYNKLPSLCYKIVHSAVFDDFCVTRIELIDIKDVSCDSIDINNTRGRKFSSKTHWM